MLRIQQRLISFSIVSHKIAHATRDYKNDPILNFVFILFILLVSCCWIEGC